MTFTAGNLAYYEKMMKRTPIPGRNESPKCNGCTYYRPDWKYRTCFYTRCYRNRNHRTYKDIAYEITRGEI